MILSDNETRNDLLNNDAIAKTIVSLIKESKDQPISLGIHGDWGAGKSSILEMVEDALSKEPRFFEKKYSCIRFNGWKHQGFEDSKVALMSAIVSELKKKEKLGPKAEEILKKLWKNINWMSVAKTAGKTAFGLATGTAPLTVLSSAFSLLKDAASPEEKVSETISSIGAYLKDAKIIEDTSSNTEFAEFQKNFDELLEDAKIGKLVVLIDDLDRCLPDVAIETLEAVRLFMFTGKTAFVIAADESMIRYAVKKHFPDVVDENKYNASYEFSSKYLEKLIQVPFKIPALGEVEACIYIMLLLVGSVLPADNENYTVLCNDGKSRMQKPWGAKPFTVEEVKSILKSDYEKASEVVLIATQICHILSSNTEGNPRKIKRFINMLLLRYEIAVNRGFGDKIELPILAKMMLAEYYCNDFYRELPKHLSKDGIWTEYPEIRSAITANNDEKGTDNQWFEGTEVYNWIVAEPDLSQKELVPYYYACKEKIDYFAGRTETNDLSEIVDLLFAKEMTIVARIDELKKLTLQQAEQILDIVTQKILEKSQFEKKPDGIEGLIVLTQTHPELQMKLVTFVDTLPVAKVGLWVVSGWDKAIPKGSDAKKILDKYLDKLEKDGNKTIKMVVKNARKE